jgi:hypothetical protein
MSRSKRDAFDAVIVWALAEASEHVPLPVQLSFSDIPGPLRDLLAEVASDEREQARIWTESIGFLEREGYILGKPSHRDARRIEFVRLTEKALYVLDAVPTALGGESVGSRLRSVAKEAGKESARAVLAETVGVIIGTAARTLSGGS